MTLVIVTATTNPIRALPCINSWGTVPIICVVNGNWERDVPPLGDASTTLFLPNYQGSVAAFEAGVTFALDQTDADLIACFHDDLELLEPAWPEIVMRCFERRSACGLAGFGGAIGLGADTIYQTPYDPMQLARIGFRSNLVDAEQHGLRSLLSERVACLDGFSQIGRRAFWDGYRRLDDKRLRYSPEDRPWTTLKRLGLTHHIYDGALGLLAARHGWETWYVPMRARHYGGQTAVADAGYQAWAQTQHKDGDHGFWKEGHRTVYEAFKDVLPLRV